MVKSDKIIALLRGAGIYAEIWEVRRSLVVRPVKTENLRHQGTPHPGPS